MKHYQYCFIMSGIYIANHVNTYLSVGIGAAFAIMGIISGIRDMKE